MPRRIKLRLCGTRVFQPRVSYMQFGENPRKFAGETRADYLGFRLFQMVCSSVEMEHENFIPTSLGKRKNQPLCWLCRYYGLKADTDTATPYLKKNGCSFYREKCFLPLKLALESRSSKLSLHAINGLQVCSFRIFLAVIFVTRFIFCTVNEWEIGMEMTN